MVEHELYAKQDSSWTDNATLRISSKAGPVVAHVTHWTFKEAGEVALSNPAKKYLVTHKHFSGHWMRRPATSAGEEVEPLITTHKPKWKSKRMELTIGDETFEMIATSSSGRWYSSKDDYVVDRLETATDAQTAGEAGKGKKTNVVSIAKLTYYKNKVAISYCDGVAVELPVFCYWIANMYHSREDARRRARPTT